MLPSKCHGVPVSPGDVLHFVTWGGGGWGDPLERDPELVALEVRRGLVTAKGAERYGVCVQEDGALDDELPHLIDCMTTNKTDFFREPNHFNILVDKMLPD